MYEWIYDLRVKNRLSFDADPHFIRLYRPAFRICRVRYILPSKRKMLLSYIKKIFEKVIFARVYKYLEIYNLLYEKQFGVRKKNSIVPS